MFRYDRTLIKQKFYQQMETIVIPSRHEASITLSIAIYNDQLDAFLKEKKLRLFPWILFVCLKVVQQHPELNRFIMGHRLFQHRLLTIATVVKKDKRKVGYNSLVKLNLSPETTAHQIQKQLDKQVDAFRNEKNLNTDKLTNLLKWVPAGIFKLFFGFAKWLDTLDLLPNSIIDNDPLHSSLMIANLGSIQGQSVAHHLYNWGTASMFITVGQLTEHGNLDITFTIDERISEGIVFFRALELFKTIMEHPDEYYC